MEWQQTNKQNKTKIKTTLMENEKKNFTRTIPLLKRTDQSSNMYLFNHHHHHHHLWLLPVANRTITTTTTKTIYSHLFIINSKFFFGEFVQFFFVKWSKKNWTFEISINRNLMDKIPKKKKSPISPSPISLKCFSWKKNIRIEKNLI